MKKLVGIVSVIAFPAFAAVAKPIWVSPDGNDGGSGTAESPYRTLVRALEVSRSGKGLSVLRLKDGFYELGSTLRFGPEDSGLTVEAERGAHPVVSGGRRITGWRVDGRGWWRVRPDFPERFSQLYVNGVRRFRPHLPRKGYFAAEDEASPDPANGFQRIKARRGDVDPSADGMAAAEFCVFHVWTMSRLPFVSMDADGIVTFGRKRFSSHNFPMGELTCYRIDNLRAALGEPGDWYLERDGELVYVPRPGERPEKAEVVAPRLTRLVEADGVTDLVFRGLTFEHAGFDMPSDGQHYRQAALSVPSAIVTRKCRGVRLERCTVAQTGGWAVDFGFGSHDCAVADSHLVDLGAGGVKIGSFDADRNVPESWCGGCAVTNCLIECGGRVDPAGEGVWIGFARNNHVVHNTIRDFYYSGVSSGWTWSLGTQPTSDNVIEWNHIHHLGQYVLADMGGIYTLGEQHGTVLRFNHIHDIDCRCDGNGIYFDSGSSHIAVSNNVVHDCSRACWFQAVISSSNRVVNNVFARAGQCQVKPLPPHDASSGTGTVFAGNAVVWKEGVLLWEGEGGGKVSFADNLAWHDDPKTVLPKGFTRGKAKAKPFDLAAAGCHEDVGSGVRIADVPAAFETVEPPYRPFSENFERFEVGQPPAKWQVFQAKATNLVCVTEGSAFEGRKSLLVRDSLASWMPHFCRIVTCRPGPVRLTMAMRIGKGAKPSVILRDPERGVATPGPLVRIGADGHFYGNGVRMMAPPVDKWFWLKLTFAIGPDRGEPVYSVTLSTEGCPPQTVSGIRYDPGFRKFGWLGFTSDSSDGEEWELDDIRIDQ